MKALSNEKKEEVIMLKRQGKTHRQIAAISGVSAGSVTYILQARTSEKNKSCNIPKYLWDEWDILNERYGKNGTHIYRTRRTNR